MIERAVDKATRAVEAHLAERELMVVPTSLLMLWQQTAEIDKAETKALAQAVIDAVSGAYELE